MLAHITNNEKAQVAASIKEVQKIVLRSALRGIANPDNLQTVPGIKNETLYLPRAVFLKSLLQEFSICCIERGLGLREDASNQIINNKIISCCKIEIYDLETGTVIWRVSDVGEGRLDSDFGVRIAYTLALNRVIMKLIPDNFARALNFLSSNSGDPEIFAKYSALLKKHPVFKD